MALLIFAAGGHAAGLGRLTVLSDLGEPLRAEIDVVAVEKAELDTLGAKLGSPDAYAQANLPYPAPSIGLKLELDKRANGEPYISATSIAPVNEPFVDILVDLTWNGGRIQRAYTALLDPPTYAKEEQPATAPPTVRPAPVAAPETVPAPRVETQLGSEMSPKLEAAEPVMPPAADSTAPPEAMPPEARAPEAMEAPLPGAMDRAAPPAPADATAVAPPAEAGMPLKEMPAPDAAATYGPVKYGDTLSKIALQHKPVDVTLEQMLVILYRNNRDAFMGNNMNRLRTGKVLQLPDASELSVLDSKVARQEVRVQSADFRAYKDRLGELVGAAPTDLEPAGQAAAGRVTGAPTDTAPSSVDAPKEVLKLSKGEAAGSAGGQAGPERIRTLEEEVASRDRTIREQNERVAKLEKTIKDMQALLELKNKGMAELQQPSATPVVPPTSTKPELGKSPLTTPPIPAKPDTAAPAAPMADSGAPAARPADAAPLPKARPKPKVVTPPPAPTFAEQVFGNPMYLAAGAGILLLLGGLAYMMLKRRRSDGVADSEAEKKTSDVAAAADAAGAPVAVSGTAPTDQGASGEEVDPLAEAEIYLAYGRDAQAEEILKEALATSPRRAEIQVKLLEIYAKRKDGAAFDAVARDLHGASGGQGGLWEKAARLGYQLDPNNPRYLAGKPNAEVAAAFAATAAVAAPGTLGGKALDFQIDSLEPQAEIGTLTDIDAGFGRRFATTTAASASNDRLDLNIDLDDADTRTKTDIDLSRLGGAGGGTTTDIDLSNLAAAGGTSTDIDLSKIAEGGAQIDFDVAPEAAPKVAAAGGSGVDFDFELPAVSGGAHTSTQTVTRAMSQTVADVGDARGSKVEFDLSQISLEPSEGRTEPKLGLGAAGANMAEFDLSSINLDLAEHPAGAASATAAKDDRWHDVQTKFDLAKAYQEMGDREGAREILREVIVEGDAEQKSAAEKVLEALA